MVASAYDRAQQLSEFFARYKRTEPVEGMLHAFTTQTVPTRNLWKLFNDDLSNLNVRTIRDACVKVKDRFDWCEHNCKSLWDLMFVVENEMETFPNGYSINNQVAGFVFCFSSDEDATLFKMFHF